MDSAAVAKGRRNVKREKEARAPINCRYYANCSVLESYFLCSAVVGSLINVTEGSYGKGVVD